ncbi:hypothetical protein LJC00_00865 [Dysgonomonas sp. OttesenSCG-928-M03]|nr:hypothetical protein [Dysgonomonas sp. OttesenSCG-928-M03]
MKRLFMLVAAVIALGSTAFASNGEYEVISKLNNKKTIEGVSSYLKVNFYQREYMEDIFALSAKKMEKAMDGGVVSDTDAKKALAFNLANMKDILSPDQYKKYLVVLNISVNNMNQANLLAENK